ncbi:Interleukin enhancer-binding factor 2 -like protein [Echinococcus granulosus]|uniref:Interleukin enhancer-binding factor 2 n=1 Tax=Echinococcus granulosus TaxID=6210 RepID=U6IXJ5_ECHGR|nr:Interleukin enhancer-binding factor 2 [Echinococcus granulosus]EUB57231.1 Interleukin enhancer-binding factor 2 [Echinococcus granulosus]KAH9286158.1 Interleukin enhancer-binding factor 2 -like protein [Echinococcus granulosus]CDS15762.1 interleukin enhancer binding factor 2 [Echinococcus granulosus]
MPRIPFQKSSYLSQYRGMRPNSYTAHMPFDPICCSAIFPGAEVPQENERLSKLLMDSHSQLTPSLGEQQAVATLVAKVVEYLESIALEKGHSQIGQIEEIRVVGSFKEGTMLAGHCLADVVVLLRDSPTFEMARNISLLLKQKFLDKEIEEPEEPLEIIHQPYGFDLEYLGVCIRVAFAVQNFSAISNTETGLHISPPDQHVAHAAIVHARWAEERAAHANVKALIRLLKDLRRRFVGFNHLTPWQVDLLAFHAVMHNPMNAPLPLSVAFRRVIQVLAAGLFLPGSTGIIDPCEPQNRRVHVSLNLIQQDELCCAAQTVCKILNLEKFSILFSNMHPARPITLAELVEAANALPGEKIALPEPICLESHSTAPDTTTKSVVVP